MPQTITVNVVSSASTSSTSGYFIVSGDFTSLFYPGFKFQLFNENIVPYPETIDYTVVSSSLVGTNTQVNVNVPLFGSIISFSGSPTPVTGPYISGTYNNVPLTGGTGQGAQATVVNVGPGPIASFGTLTGGTGYTNGTYNSVPLTGGTGTGAVATVVITGGFVVNVQITVAGTGYAVGDVLSASNTHLGNVGSGFSIPVATVSGTISSVTLINAGVGYATGNVLTFSGVGTGTGTVVVGTVTNTETGTITLQNNQPMFTVGQQVFVISAGNSSCQTPWWSMMPTQTPIPAVQPATILAVTVYYSNQINSPTITYSVRLGNQPGAAMVDQSEVFVDLPTAIAAYEAQLAG